MTKGIFFSMVFYVVTWVLVILCSLGIAHAKCNLLNSDYVSVHKYNDGVITRQKFDSNNSFVKDSSKEWINKKIKKRIKDIVIEVINQKDCEYFVVSYVDAYCSVKNVFYDVELMKKSIMAKTYPKNAYAKNGRNNGKNR